MGYRSDVYMCITGPKDRMLAELASMRLQGDAVMHAALDEWAVVAISDSHAAMTLGGQGVDWKWYESYPGVAAHLAIYNHFQEIEAEAEAGPESGFDGVFVRIGEDNDDAESSNFGDEGYELGQVQRGIFRAYDGMGEDLRPRIAATQTP